MQPLVSIIIPTYNRAHLIGETLESVISQTFHNWECIVIDDGSTDVTAELMEFYCEKDGRIHYHQRPDDRPKGANACRNYGFTLSKGKYINWLDSDDVISNYKIEEQVNLLESSNEYSLATCRWGFFSYNKQNILKNLNSYRDFNSSKEFLKALFQSHGYFPTHSYLINRAIIEKSGGWNEYLKINQDGEFMARVICNTQEFYFARNAVALYRYSDKDNVSIITQGNITDYYNSWKLIDSYLKIRFDNERIEEFELFKKRILRRIPKQLSFYFKKDTLFFSDILKEQMKPFSVFRKIKKRLMK